MLCYLLALATSAWAADDSDLTRLLNAKSLRCTFTTGVSAIFETTRPQVEQYVADTRARPGPGGTEIRATDPIYFDSIDYRAEKARLIAQLGSASVAAYATAAGVYFVDRPALGGIVLYFVFGRTISASAASLGEFIVVSTMNITVPGQAFSKNGRWVPVTDQSYGTCKIWQ
jgi:hypothetical protein